MFSIITDTSANLPSGYLRENHILSLPFFYIIDGKEYEPNVTFDGPSFYAQMRQGVRVTTSQITPQQFLNGALPLLEKGEDVLYVGMSSGISGAFASASKGTEGLIWRFPDRKIRLVDTLSASLGEGLLVMEAVRCREAGMSLDETADLLMTLRHRMCQVFSVDDLKYLRATGRVSGVKALLGTVLNIKPLLKGDRNGRIVCIDRARGRARAITALAEKYNALAVEPEKQVVGIAHADCPEDAERLASLLRTQRPPKDILTVCYEPVTGSHVGPGALALFFLGDQDVRDKA